MAILAFSESQPYCALRPTEAYIIGEFGSVLAAYSDSSYHLRDIRLSLGSLNQRMGKTKADTIVKTGRRPQLHHHAPVISEVASTGQRDNGKFRPVVRSEVGQPFAAIQSLGALDQQRLAPLQSVDRHVAQPAKQAKRQVQTVVLRLPKQLRRFLAGAAAGAFAKTGTAPLETLRMSLMTSTKSQPLQIIRDTWKQGGIAGFFNGNAADILRVMPSKAIELGAFDGFKRLCSNVSLHNPLQGVPVQIRPQADGYQIGPVATMFAGALAGLTSTIMCFPLETVRTRLAVEPGRYSSVWNCLAVTAHASGPSALYKGVTASAVGAVPYSALRFGAFDGLKHIYRRRHGRDIPPMVLVGLGAAAGLAASSATFPLEVVRRRMMAGASYPNVAAAISQIAREEGWTALYRGLGVSCIKQAPQTGLTLWAYDTCKWLLDIEKS